MEYNFREIEKKWQQRWVEQKTYRVTEDQEKKKFYVYKYSNEYALREEPEINGEKGRLNFSVYTYEPITIYTERGVETLKIDNPEYVQMPIIKAVVNHLQKKGTCTCDGISATPVNWVMDKILGKI